MPPPARRGRRVAPLLALLVLLASCASGEPDLEVGTARAGVPAGGATQITLEITNHGDGDDQLVGAGTPAAAAVELHETVIDDGQASMVEHEAVPLPAGETVSFRPGSLHLMMVLPDESVDEGGTFPLTLRFEASDERTVEVEVVPTADLLDGPVAE